MAKRQQTTAAEARARQHRRTTKPKGLVTREKQLTSTQRELSTLRETGIATRAQLSQAQLSVTRAKRNVKAQKDAAKRAGRPTT